MASLDDVVSEAGSASMVAVASNYFTINGVVIGQFSNNGGSYHTGTAEDIVKALAVVDSRNNYYWDPDKKELRLAIFNQDSSKDLDYTLLIYNLI